MKCRRLVHNPLLSSIRYASTHWRHVESPPPLPRPYFKTKAPANSPTLEITVHASHDNVVQHSKVVKTFHAKTPEGAVLRFEGELYDLLQDPTADESYRSMYRVKNSGFVQFRQHLHTMLFTDKKRGRRFVMTGERQCGKTMSCYALLIHFLTYKHNSLVLPALHLARWFQDTDITQFTHTDKGMLDFPEFNAEFLRFFVSCNRFSKNPNKDVLKNTVLSEDERWTSQLYSFKGDSLLNVANVGISTPPVAGHVIDVILSSIMDQQVPTQVIVDNANLLSEIHSSKFEGLRNLEAEDWWNQPPLLPDNITMLRSLKNFISSHKKGEVFLTIDPRREISDRVIAETGNRHHEPIHIPNTPSEKEYLQFLSYMRKEKFISSDLDDGMVTELSYLTGRSYVDTYKYMFII